MVTKEELEDILHDEEIEARYNSIDIKRLDKLDKEHKWYLEYTKKDYHPMSYRIKKELERSAPQSQGLTDEYVSESIDYMFKVGIGVMVFWYLIGFIAFMTVLIGLY